MNSTKLLSLVFVLFLINVSITTGKLSKKSKTSTQLTKTETDFYSKDASKYLSKTGIECTIDNCPEPNYCGNSKTVCYCAKGLANYPFTGVKDVYCQYEQHAQLTGFLWELLLNMGIGHFNIGQNLMGTFKLLVLVIPIVLFVLGKLSIIKVGFKEGGTGFIMMCVVIAFALTSFAWWLADAIMFGTNKYRDRYDVPLKKW